MKKLTIILFFFAFLISFSQTKTKFFSENDIMYIDSMATFKTKTFLLKNGLDEFKEVKISMNSTKESLKNITIQKLNMIIQTANSKTKYTLKSKSTYSPLKIFVAFIENEWTVTIDYTAQNDYGATKDGKTITIFDDKGEFKNQL
jgi:hypothetical protein